MSSVITILSILSPLFALIAGGNKGRRGVMWVYAWVCLIADLLTSGLKHCSSANYRVIPLWFALAEFLILSYYYQKALNQKPGVFLIVVCLLSAFYLGRIYYLEASFFLGMSLFLFTYIAYSIAGFYKILQHPLEAPLTNSSFFWVNVAFLIYGAGAFLLLLFRDYMTKEDFNLYKILWTYVFVSLNIIKNTFIGISFLKMSNTPDEHR